MPSDLSVRSSETSFEGLLNPLLEQPKELLKLLEKLDCEERLTDYIRAAWHVLEPSRQYEHGYHIDAIADHLTAITYGHINRLLINVPPGFMKSLLTCVFWPSWEWGPRNMPATRYVSAAYSEDLTIRDNRRCRDLMQSRWYQERWGDRFDFGKDQNAKTMYTNTKTGFRVATSVSGLGTGERGDRFIIDDPHNVKDGESDAKRQSALLWFTETVPTRMNDPEKSAIIVIMQRVHSEDVSGYIEANNADLGYTHLMLPMEFEPERKCVVYMNGKKFFEDWRQHDGELLYPERFPEHVVERDKKVMGVYATAGQFQQRPTARSGGMFSQDWFRIIEEVSDPNEYEWVRAWDLAASEPSKKKKFKPAFTAGVKFGMNRRTKRFVIAHVTRFQELPGTVEDRIKGIAAADGRKTIVSLPKDPGQAGKAQISHYITKVLPHFIVEASPETGSKELRAELVSQQASVGNIDVVRGPWNKAFFEELTTFPSSVYKDQVDALSRAYLHFLEPKAKTTSVRAKIG